MYKFRYAIINKHGKYESCYPGRGFWYKTIPHYRSVKQASFAYIQQTYDILSAVVGDDSWYKS